MEIKTIEHKKLGVKAVIKVLTQRDLEAFGAAYSEEKTNSASQMRGANTRAAIKAGWFAELEPAIKAEEVGDQPPAVVWILGDFVDQAYREATAIPPE